MKLKDNGINFEFYNYIKPMAVHYGKIYNLPYEFLCAIACLEAGWKQPLYNNYFNIKYWGDGKEGIDFFYKDTYEFKNGKREEEPNAKFKVYLTMNDSFIDFCEKVLKNKIYETSKKLLNDHQINFMYKFFEYIEQVNIDGYSTKSTWKFQVIDILNRIYYYEKYKK